jgi:hypothetical protein
MENVSMDAVSASPQVRGQGVSKSLPPLEMAPGAASARFDQLINFVAVLTKTTKSVNSGVV